jgi:adenosylhomocysteine nucleosidase
MSFDGGAVPAAAPRTAVIAALAFERATLARYAPPGTSGWFVVQSGPGPERAARSATAAIAEGARALLSWGLAGGLATGVAPGTVVVPQHVIMQRGESFRVDAAWQERLGVLGSDFPIDSGDLLTVPVALASPAAKAAAAVAIGAVAVDMESAAIAAVAARSGVPFVALRVVVDAQRDALPASAESWIDEHGNRRATAALGALSRPGEWRALWRLAQRYRTASGVLRRLASSVAARRLLDDAGAAVVVARS